MAVAFLLDEHFRVHLFDAILRHNALGGLPIGVEQVGDPSDWARSTRTSWLGRSGTDSSL